MTTEEKLAMAKVWFKKQAAANGMGFRGIHEDGPGIPHYQFVAFAPGDVDPDKHATFRMSVGVMKKELELNSPGQIIDLMRVRWRAIQESSWHKVLEDHDKIMELGDEGQDTIQ